MKIQYISDLHLEFPENRRWLRKNMIIPQGDILLIAGDTIIDDQKRNGKFFHDYLAKNFKHVISIKGNHEFYFGRIDYVYPNFKKQISDNNLVINNETVIFENVKIIASTLWTNVPKEFEESVANSMNDYGYIKNDKKSKNYITVQDTNKFNLISRDFIEEELSKPFEGKIILLTHHLPLFELYRKRLKKDSDYMKYGYANDLSEILNKYKIDYWIFGHMHHSIDEKIGNTQFLCNPLGYVEDKPNKNFKTDKYFEV